MSPTFSQLLAEVTLASADTSPLEDALALALDFIERETDFYDLGRALGKAYPNSTPLPEPLNRVTLPRQSGHGPKRWDGQATRDLVVALHTFELSALAEVILLDAQQRSFARAPLPSGSPPWAHTPQHQDVALIRLLMRIHNPRVEHDPLERNRFLSLGRLTPSASK